MSRKWLLVAASIAAFGLSLSNMLAANDLSASALARKLQTQGNNTSSIIGSGVFKKSSNRVDHYVFKPRPILKQRHLLGQRQLPGNKIFVSSPWVNHQLVEHNANFTPHNMEIHVFNDTSMTQSSKLIDQELKRLANVTGAWESYQLLRPWAYRADLWRLMILWSEGGIYLDGKMKLHVPIESWAALAQEEELSLCLDHFDQWKPTARQGQPTPIFYQAVISARKRSPILLETIKMIIENVSNRYYPSTSDGIPPQQSWLGSLAITGPVVIGLAVTKFPENTYRRELKLRPRTGIHQAGKEGMIMSRDLDEHKKVHQQGGAFYYDLFKEHAVYCDSHASKNHSDCNLEALLKQPQYRQSVMP
jgi:Glycosyltransferase sugar-binding region containing DXD motif